jgi:septal ring factor EnvC (AmiA/AmiB activator)
LRYLFYILLFFFSINVNAQSRVDLEKKKNEKYKEIEYTNKQINKTTQEKKATVNKLLILRNQITTRKELVNDLNTEITSLDITIGNLSSQIDNLNVDITKLKADYANSIYRMYYYEKNYSTVMFILSANDFNQAYNRLNYLKQYSAYRKQQVNKITIKTIDYSVKIKELDKKKQTKLELVDEKTIEAQKLEGDVKEEKQILDKLSGKESDLKKELATLQKNARKLEKEIEDLIKNEREKTKTKKSQKSIKDDDNLSKDFSKNKGFLPSPTDNGVIISKFGKQSHPVIKGIIINNNGIDISTNSTSLVRSVFTGEVSKIFTIKGSNFIVILRHGNYLTVYQNLENVSVKVGEKVKTQQVIGKVFSDENANFAVLHFELWQELNKLNPADWIKNFN